MCPSSPASLGDRPLLAPAGLGFGQKKKSSFQQILTVAMCISLKCHLDYSPSSPSSARAHSLVLWHLLCLGPWDHCASFFREDEEPEDNVLTSLTCLG